MNWTAILAKIDNLFASDYYTRNSKKLNFLMLLFVLLFVTYLLSLPYITNKLQYKLGDIASEEVRVPFDIQYVVPSETEKLQEEAAAKQPYVFDRDYAVFKTIIEKLQIEFQTILRSRHEQYEKNSLAIMRSFPMLKDRNLYPTPILKELLSLQDSSLESAAIRLATFIFDNYAIITDKVKDSKQLLKVGAIGETVNTPDKQVEISWDYEHVLYHKNLFLSKQLTKFSDEATALLANSQQSQEDSTVPAQKPIVNEQVIRFVTLRVLTYFYRDPPVSYNEKETLRRQQAAADAVKPVMATLKKGLTILRQGDPIDSDKLRKIEIYNSVQDKSNFKFFLGSFLVQMVLILAVTFYIDRFTEMEREDFQGHFILHTLLFVAILLAFFVSRIELVHNSELYFALFIPSGFLSILVAVFFGPRVAIAITVYFSFFMYFLSAKDSGSLLITFITMMSSIYAGEKMRSRSSFVRGATVNALSVLTVTLGADLWLYEYSSNLYLKGALAVANGFLGVIVALGLMPLYEVIFNIPTRFRLMELSDFDNPLLRKIAAEAPSTYTHSLMMSSLSERAVAKIGGNALLTRVGCMYHDIGKTLNPAFYSENRHLYEDTDLSGTSAVEYASIIIQHVVDGMRMAKQSRLPKKVIDFIPEHHGDSIIRYFYHKALENRSAEKLETVDLETIKDMFRYPGPKPRSKETGVVMLADSVEATSRSISNPTLENLSDMVEKITANKIAEHQLDNCPLTMADLKTVKETFVEVLVSSFHARPKYPTVKRLASLEKAVAKEEQASAQNKVHTVANKTTNKTAATSKKQTSSQAKKRLSSQGKSAETKTQKTNKSKMPKHSTASIKEEKEKAISRTSTTQQHSRKKNT